jgi:putative ABC transport system substrate-binding protein
MSQLARRQFITIFCGAAAWPLAARAQQPHRIRRVGVLSGVANDLEGQARVAAFRDGLRRLGWLDGRNIRFEYRWDAGSPARARTYAAELVRQAPDVILVAGTPPLAAIQRETTTVPVVFAQASDPVGGGFVASIAHPGGNITGFTDFEYDFSAKWVEKLKTIAPNVVRAAVLYDSTSSLPARFLPYIEAAAPSFGVQLSKAPLRDADDVERAIDEFAPTLDSGLIVLAGSATLRGRDRIASQAIRHRIPAVYPYRAFALSGGLISYGVDILDMYRGAATYVDRILRGERPANLPVQFATKFELVVNLKAANAIGLTVPATVLIDASEVIE